MHTLSFLMRFLSTNGPEEESALIERIIKNKEIPSEAKDSIAEALYNIVAKEENGVVVVNTEWLDITMTMFLLSVYTTLEFSTEEDGSHGDQFLKEVLMLKQNNLPERIYDAIGPDCGLTKQIINEYFRHKQRMAELHDQKCGTWEDLGFRRLYHRYVLLLDDGTAAFRAGMKLLDARQEDNAVLAYGYIDRTAGLSLKSLCSVHYLSDGTYDLNKEPPSGSLTIRYGSGDGPMIPVPRDSRFDQFDFMIEIVHKCYSLQEGIEKTRNIAALDPFRHPQHPDDVQVHLEQDDFDREVVWVRLTDVHESELQGILLNEPNQNFGCHVQDLLKMEYDEINSRLIAIL